MPATAAATIPVAAADARVDEILVAARAAFAEKGFERTSMQDLARAAGMSAGNFYRYFASKDALIETMVARDLSAIAAQFAQVMEATDPRVALAGGLLAQLDANDRADQALWCEILAEARRKPVIGAMYDAMHAQILGHLLAAFARITDTPVETAQRRFGAHAEAILLLLQGAHLRRRPGDGFADSPLRSLLRRHLTQVLDEALGGAAGGGTNRGGHELAPRQSGADGPSRVELPCRPQHSPAAHHPEPPNA